MVPDTVLTPIVSVAAGGISVGWAVKFMLGNWLKGHDKMAASVSEMAKEVAEVKTFIKGFQKTEESTQKQEIQLGVIEYRLTDIDTRMKDRDHKLHMNGGTP